MRELRVSRAFYIVQKGLCVEHRSVIIITCAVYVYGS